MRGLCIPKWSFVRFWINKEREREEKKWNKSKIFSAVINSVKYVTLPLCGRNIHSACISVCEEPFQPEKRVKIYNEIIFLLTLSYKMCGWGWGRRCVRQRSERKKNNMWNCKGVRFFTCERKTCRLWAGDRHLSHLREGDRNFVSFTADAERGFFGKRIVSREDPSACAPIVCGRRE